MARSVYADPFGAYIGGYDTGVQREQQVQQNVRQARDMDWNYYNIKPIELETAQRNNAFQAYADPYQRELLPIGVHNARNAQFMGDVNAAAVPAFAGIQQPFVDAITSRYGYASTGTPGAQQLYGPTGEPMGPLITPEATTNPYYLRQEQYQREKDNRQYGLDLGQYNVSSMNATTAANQSDIYGRSIALQENKAGANGGVGYAPGTPLHNSMFGGSAVAPAPAPQNAGQANDAVQYVIGQLAAKYGRSPQEVMQALAAKGYTPQQVVEMYATQPQGQPAPQLPAAYTPPAIQ